MAFDFFSFFKKPAYIDEKLKFKAKINDNFVEDNRFLYSFDGATKYEIAMMIWNIVRSVKYEADQNDNWQQPLITFCKGSGDCEDTAVLFVALCNEFGYKPEEVYNAIGRHKQFGFHSFPIMRLGGEWYVFECTDSKIEKPIRLKGSDYEIDILQNWKYHGGLREKYKKDFCGEKL